MRSAGCALTPSSSLPALRSLDSLPEDDVFSALRSLTALYCPLAFHLDPDSDKTADGTPVDSGYTSGTEDGDSDDGALAALRADGFERDFAERWLTGLISRAEELACLTSDEARERVVEDASRILEAFFSNAAEEEQMQEELADYARDFSFDVASPQAQAKGQIDVRLNDGLAGQDAAEPDDVGLQSWGASIVFSQLLCADPARFGIAGPALGDSPRIVDLGAGTGLVSLVLAKLLPRVGIADATVVATDYQAAVLGNLRANIASNFASGSTQMHAAQLDWSAPSHEPPLDKPADMLLATDVVYAAEHAVWLRDCATGLLAPEGVFWLLVTIRDTGRFDGVSDTVEAAFAADDRPQGKDGRRLTIFNEQRLEKRNGIGRGDEGGYRLFRIGWA